MTTYRLSEHYNGERASLFSQQELDDLFAEEKPLVFDARGGDTRGLFAFWSRKRETFINRGVGRFPYK